MRGLTRDNRSSSSRAHGMSKAWDAIDFACCCGLVGVVLVGQSQGSDLGSFAPRMNSDKIPQIQGTTDCNPPEPESAGTPIGKGTAPYSSLCVPTPKKGPKRVGPGRIGSTWS